MARRVRPDAEGFYYFAKSDAGVLYGPYSSRSVAAGVATQMTPWGIRNEFTYRTIPGTYRTERTPNPRYAPERVLKVYKSRMADMQEAPYLSLREKYENVAKKLARIEKMLSDRGIDIQFD